VRTIAVYNVKGGVGKTAAAVNLAYLAAQSGLKTLLWDLDPQGAASWYFNLKSPSTPDKSVWRGETALAERVQTTAHERLHLIPADLASRHLDAWLRRPEAPRDTLRRRLKSVAGDYDLALLDCPPSLSHLAENLFIAADLVLVPVVPTHLSLRALKTLIDHFKEEKLPREKLKPFFSMVDRRRLLHRMLEEQPPRTMRDVCKAAIPYASAVERMGEHRAPLELTEPWTPAAQAFRELWKEAWSAVRAS
jgi:cellulose biosynthesis protein BcsQ